MKKVVIIIAAVGILGGLAGSGIYLWVTRQKAITTTNLSSENASAKLVDWNDPAGLAFQYPDGLTVDKHDEDKQNYAHVELTDPAHPGRLIVWAKDTTALDVAAWVKTDKQFTGAPIIDTTLGGEPAKKILVTTPVKKLFIGTIFDELLFFVEIELGEDDYWQGVADTVSTSFRFIPLPGEQPAGSATTEEYAVDEEEVIE